MERLTNRITNRQTGEVLAYGLESGNQAIKAYRKLGQYEDAEEQGLLFQFPCKVGDIIYALSFTNDTPRYYECEVEQIIIHSGVVEMNALIKLQHIRTRIDIALIGKTVFLTENEAYQKLKELQN